VGRFGDVILLGWPVSSFGDLKQIQIFWAPQLFDLQVFQYAAACASHQGMAPMTAVLGTCRAGEAPSVGLTEALQSLGFETSRLKTGTPARVDRSSVNFAAMQPQPGDDPVSWFTFDTRLHIPREQMSCYLTYTNAATHDLIRDNLHESPAYGGWVEAKGPRYCPSIEDKIVRFADKERHQIFIEPESRSTPELYIQGFSTGLPERLQLAMLQTLPGLEQCRMMRPAYAVEYDYLPAYQCHSTLETKRFGGLFFSGQLNGTTGATAVRCLALASVLAPPWPPKWKAK
jgi:tRNA uridine 5-carboxymethylaminomethyl modification enzyme